jgi:hypothetical protein
MLAFSIILRTSGWFTDCSNGVLRNQNSNSNFKIKIRIQTSKSKFDLLNQCLPFNLLQVDRNFTVPSRKFIKTDNDRVFVYTCINWFYSYTNYIETKLEENYSIASFQQWITKSNKVSPSLKTTFTRTYLGKGFQASLA